MREVTAPADAPPTATTAELRAVPIFAELADDELRWIAAHTEVLELEAGDPLFAPGDPADWMFIGLAGTVHARRPRAGAGAPAFVFHAGEIGGTVPFSRMATFAAMGRAATRARVGRFPRARFDDLLARVPSLATRFATLLLDRVRESTRRDAQYEKLASLGKLSAGIAHELNNPASAARRAVAEARRRGAAFAPLTAALDPDGVAGRLATALEELRDPVRRAEARRLDAIARAEREDEVAGWLGRTGVGDPGAVAATLVDAGLDVPALEHAIAGLPADARVAALGWLETVLATDAVLDDADDALRRISSLVDDVKGYTHMDRGREMLDTDIHAGIESTLALCARKAGDLGVTLEKRLAPELPRLHAHPAELNEVWAHLVDNALDATAPSHGRVVVTTAVERDAIVVEVRDDGPGVPEEIQDRIWEPFFTTKEVGRGTGLGLDIARRIITDQHGGELLLSSVPGDTRFTVRLPLSTMGTFGA